MESFDLALLQEVCRLGCGTRLPPGGRTGEQGGRRQAAILITLSSGVERVRLPVPETEAVAYLPSRTLLPEVRHLAVPAVPAPASELLASSSSFRG